MSQPKYKDADDDNSIDDRVEKLDQESICRYSRQLTMPEIGMKGQQALLKGSVLVIGAGGLGCPAIQYLTAAGVGRIGIVDYDEVEMSNLHRQILHTEAKAKRGMRKATSAAEAASSLNSKTKLDEYHVQLDKNNAVKIIGEYDVIIDATDNVPSRYLISDACVITNKPLVSGGALRWEGQLTTYHYKLAGELTYGPCYRCMYPNPPAPETVTNCSDGGVLGVVPGIIGCIQALEAIKILAGLPPSYHQKLLVFDGLHGGFRNIKLRGQQNNCIACGENRTIEKDCLPNYEEFCGMAATDKCMSVNILSSDQRITANDYKAKFVDGHRPHLLLDVRQPVELDICVLPNTTNVPIKTLEYCRAKIRKLQAKNGADKLDLSASDLSFLCEELEKVKCQLENSKSPIPIVVVCKQGNDSQKAVDILNQYIDFNLSVDICDIKGGLMSWGSTVDKAFPYY